MLRQFYRALEEGGYLDSLADASWHEGVCSSCGGRGPVSLDFARKVLTSPSGPGVVGYGVLCERCGLVLISLGKVNSWRSLAGLKPLSKLEEGETQKDSFLVFHEDLEGGVMIANHPEALLDVPEDSVIVVPKGKTKYGWVLPSFPPPRRGRPPVDQRFLSTPKPKISLVFNVTSYRDITHVTVNTEEFIKRWRVQEQEKQAKT